MNVLSNKVLAMALVKLPAGFNHSTGQSSARLNSERKGYSPYHKCAQGRMECLKHMEERHSGLVPKYLVAERPKARQRDRNREKSSEKKARCEEIKLA